MKKTTFQQIEQAARKGNIVPVVFSFEKTSPQPLEVFEFLHEKGLSACFLESITSAKESERYTYIGLVSGEKLVDVGFEGLKSYLDKHTQSSVEEGLPPFTGGVVGYVAYDAIHRIEPTVPLPEKAVVDHEIYLNVIRTVIAYDHHAQTYTLIHNIVMGEGVDLEQAYQEACEKLEDLLAEIQLVHPQEEKPLKVTEHLPKEMTSPLGKKGFAKGFEAIKKAIYEGEVFQCVFGDSFRFPLTTTALNVYKVLRRLNPSPYMYYLACEEMTLLGTSPEMLVQVKEGQIETYPIAGTRPRGKTDDEDKALEQDLKQDEKELAEHRMLVDLARNDVGRVAEVGSVAVPKLIAVERFAHVMHLVSVVTGKLKQGLTALDALTACFPAGTLSGAPKIRAMQLISKLEPLRRGCYGGAVLFFGFNGNLTSCITIRSMVVKKGYGYVQAAAGVVADSGLEMEYQEIQHKARSCLVAAASAMEGSS